MIATEVTKNNDRDRRTEQQGGIDVAKDTHYARASDYRGIELARLLRSIREQNGIL